MAKVMSKTWCSTSSYASRAARHGFVPGHKAVPSGSPDPAVRKPYLRSPPTAQPFAGEKRKAAGRGTCRCAL